MKKYRTLVRMTNQAGTQSWPIGSLIELSEAAAAFHILRGNVVEIVTAKPSKVRPPAFSQPSIFDSDEGEQKEEVKDGGTDGS